MFSDKAKSKDMNVEGSQLCEKEDIHRVRMEEN